jgi:hypothetical protein
MSNKLDSVRKIQQTSNGSYFFYIPKDMLRDTELTKGDHVILVKRGNNISFKKYEA